METFILLARKARESAKENGYDYGQDDRYRRFYLRGHIISALQMCQEGIYIW